MSETAIYNRLQKNLRKIKPWAEKIPTNCFRIYDRDIPEYPSQIDVYGDYVVLHDRRDPIKDVGPVKQKNYSDTLEAIFSLTAVPRERLIIKERRSHAHKAGHTHVQYEKNVSAFNPIHYVVQEGRAKFKINLVDYIDVGLFLDHRPLRLRFGKSLTPTRMLNLFCYTGSVSVAAALAGSQTTNVDLSNTYLEWAHENFELNQIDTKKHSFIAADVLEFLENADIQNSSEKYDLIFLDPPTFSNSKKMASDSFEIQRDHEFLVTRCMKLLVPDGQLYFSNNRRDFKLADSIKTNFKIDAKTEWSLPADFRDPKTHHLFVICHK